MTRSKVRVGLVAGAIAALFVMAGTAGAASKGVSIEGFAFHPATLTVHVGDTVTWTNNDGTAHTATGSGFDTGHIAGGASASVTFSKAGTFAYHCAIHASMTGTVVVEAAANGGGGGSSQPTTPPTDTIAAAVSAAVGDDTRGITVPGVLGFLALAGLLGAASVTRRLARRRTS